MIERSTTWLDGTIAGATFSDDERDRFLLWRNFNGFSRARYVTFVMLNPSTATHEVSDPTVKRCEGHARRWGFSAVDIVNIFSFRSTDPDALYDRVDDRFEENLAFVQRSTRDASLVVCAWGVHGALHGRGSVVVERLREVGIDSLFCFGVTKHGHPKHPLYLSTNSPLTLFRPKYIAEGAA